MMAALAASSSPLTLIDGLELSSLFCSMAVFCLMHDAAVLWSFLTDKSLLLAFKARCMRSSLQNGGYGRSN